MTMRLPFRLFLSHAGVAVLGAAVAYLTVRLLAPPLFNRRFAMMDDMPGMGPQRSQEGVHTAFLAALDTALLVAITASLAAAAVLAVVVTHRLLRPLDTVRAATRQIAAGRYDVTVPLPAEPELSALATDVNTLAHTLTETETRRTRLLGDVAHEMRTPLTALDGYVEGLIDGVFTANPQTLTQLSEELRRLHRLADDLSTLSRAQEQRLDLHPVDADLADLARRAATRLAPQFDDAHIALVIETPSTLPVQVDPDRITQVLTNLLGNALLATPAGGTVTITARRSAHHGEVVVADTGIGLTAIEIDRVFERFYRVPGQPRRSSGSGVGLTIAKGIANAHGGDITASSPGRGRGARFIVTVPLRTDRTGDLPPRT